MASKKTLTPDEVKTHFKEQGLTFTAWAEERGYTPNAVYRVLNGCDKAVRGKAHEIAVALGLKPSPENSVDSKAA